ncbi:transporter substrate-binding domain-containing protein [Bacillus sp. FSL K6-3431]|uniref:transporter substrate-binding domain-containing protein n=1 Tax=Bacillus sp. FSL K6-3431 TaxID=2921500 RepID=UPI0030FD08EA
MKYLRNWIGITVLVLIFTTGCSKGTEDANTNKASTDDVRKIKIAYALTGVPITYQDEKGNATGYDVEIMKLVDERLPDYEFEFIPTTDDDLLIGVETGKYNVGVKNTFYTEARAKKYVYPEENLGASSSGLIMRTEDKDLVQDLSDIAELKKKLIPIAPQDAQYSLVLAYNEKNPDNQITVENSETFTVSDWPIWISEGRYDAMLTIKTSFNKTVVAKDGAYHHLKDDLTYNGFTATKTYPLFNKKEQELADAYDVVMKELKKEKIPNDLLVEFLDEDTFKLLEESN